LKVLNVITIALPSLRARCEDFQLLPTNVLEFYPNENGLAMSKISANALRALMDYEWQSNVRALEN
jgi:DNA-binding NtrC family response regulator